MDGMGQGLGGDQRGVARYHGKYPAIVMDEEPEAAALARGELLVQVPGILEETASGDGQQPIEVLARPSFPPGFYFLPEAGDRIWVEFAAGDINTPLWTGVWYPDDAAPQTADAAAPARTQKVIRTQGGHVVQLDDGEDDQIVVHHKADSRLTIDKDGHIRVEHKDGMKIEIAADHTITITADTIKLDGAVHITGDTQIDGTLTVGKGTSTKIDKNEITGITGG